MVGTSKNVFLQRRLGNTKICRYVFITKYNFPNLPKILTNSKDTSISICRPSIFLRHQASCYILNIFLADEPLAKRLKLDDDEYVDEGTAEILRGGANAQDDIADASQRAIDITTNFVYERLSLNVVAKLVALSLFTLPDEMPAAFQASFTDISTAGTDVSHF